MTSFEELDAEMQRLKDMAGGGSSLEPVLRRDSVPSRALFPGFSFLIFPYALCESDTCIHHCVQERFSLGP